MHSNKSSTVLCGILYKCLRNTLTYLLTYLLTMAIVDYSLDNKKHLVERKRQWWRSRCSTLN